MTTETISAKIAAHKARLVELSQIAQSLQTQYQQAQVEAYQQNGAISALQELLDSAATTAVEPEPANPPPQAAPTTEGLANAE